MKTTIDSKNTKKLLTDIERISAYVATLFAAVFIALYYFIYKEKSLSTNVDLQIIFELSLKILESIITIIIIFLISYVIFKKINQIKEESKNNDLINSIVTKISDHIKQPYADIFFNKDLDETNHIEDTAKEIWLIQETGSRLVESCRSKLISFLNNGGKIKILITSPETSIAELMIMRNATLQSPQSFEARVKKFREHITALAEEVKPKEDQIEIRSLSYPVSFTMAMINPNHSNDSEKEAIIILAGFKVPYEEKSKFLVTCEHSKNTFKSYQKQFNFMWNAADLVDDYSTAISHSKINAK